MSINIVKLAAQVKDLDHLARRQLLSRRRAREDGLGDIVHVSTRSMPRRREELLDGGSLYWIFQGAIQCRQKILGLDAAIDMQDRKCAVFQIDPEFIPVRRIPKKSFQGWRYLENPPEDLSTDPADTADDMTDMPADLREELSRIGIL